MRRRTLVWTIFIVYFVIGCMRQASPSSDVAVPTPTVISAVAPPTTLALAANTTGLPWWNDAVFYEIFVRSFYDSNGDGIGDFNGLIEKLDYLNDGDSATTTDLGVTGLWLMPIHPSPSYHGYDVTDYYGVNPDYGTLDEFKRLLDEAHGRGIRVVIDLVMNHTSREHAWFQQAQDVQSPYHDWYVWSDENPGGVGPWGQTVWHGLGGGKYYYGVFWEGMPDLNYTNPAVAAEMEKVAAFWLQDVGIDGFRIDGARYIIEEGTEKGTVLADSDATHAWFKTFRTFYKAINPNALTIGEVWTNSNAVAQYAQGDEFDLVFNFDLAGSLVASAQTRSADAARLGLVIAAKVLPPNSYAPFLTNHDMDRAMSQLGDELEKAKLAATLLLTAPGVPFLYYGEEIGLLGKKPDEDIRRPMQWSATTHAGFTTGEPWRAPYPDFAEKNVAAQLADPNSLLAHYRRLIALRTQHVALRSGEFVKAKASAGTVLATMRVSPAQTVLVVINLGDEAVDEYTLTLEAGVLEAGVYAAESLWDEEMLLALTIDEAGAVKPYQPTTVLAPGETLIVELVRQ